MIRLRILYTFTLTLVFIILPSKPITYDVVDHETHYCYWHLKYHNN